MVYIWKGVKGISLYPDGLTTISAESNEHKKGNRR